MGSAAAAAARWRRRRKPRILSHGAPIRRRALLSAAGLALAGCAAPVIGPTAGDAGRPAAAADITRARWVYGDHPNQYAELFRPAAGSASGVVVLLHGGFWRSVYYADQTVPLALDLAARGFAAWNLEYRGVGDGGGWPATFDDVATGIDLLTTVGDLDLSAVVVTGHSAGGQLAIWAAARAGLPSGSPGAAAGGDPDRRDLARRSPRPDHRRADRTGWDADRRPAGRWAGRPARPIRSSPIPCAGCRSASGPWRSMPATTTSCRSPTARRIVAAATAAGDRSELIEVGGGHFDVVDAGSDAWPSVVAAVSRLMGS